MMQLSIMYIKQQLTAYSHFCKRQTSKNLTNKNNNSLVLFFVSVQFIA